MFLTVRNCPRRAEKYIELKWRDYVRSDAYEGFWDRASNVFHGDVRCQHAPVAPPRTWKWKVNPPFGVRTGRTPPEGNVDGPAKNRGPRPRTRPRVHRRSRSARSRTPRRPTPSGGASGSPPSRRPQDPTCTCRTSPSRSRSEAAGRIPGSCPPTPGCAQGRLVSPTSPGGRRSGWVAACGPVAGLRGKCFCARIVLRHGGVRARAHGPISASREDAARDAHRGRFPSELSPGVFVHGEPSGTAKT